MHRRLVRCLFLNRALLSLPWIVKGISNTVDRPSEITVSDGTITDDIRLPEVPKLAVCRRDTPEYDAEPL
ncbi:hypothetical protein B0H12DRAFT_1225072 [Mycena haematopus]|nr:hypothetical protein B0H12DRAFT_1225072 [Mycena haematopus]